MNRRCFLPRCLILLMSATLSRCLVHEGYFISSPQNVTVFVGSYVSLRWDFIVEPTDALRKVSFGVSDGNVMTKGLAVKAKSMNADWKVLKNPKYASYVDRIKVDVDTPTLVISNLTASDTGFFACVLDIGLSYPPVMSHVYVKVTDILVDKNSSSTAWKTWFRRKVKLVCATRTVSTPDFKWYRSNIDGKITGITDGVTSRQGKSILKFEVRRVSDFGVYICIASTKVATVRHDIVVNTLDPPSAPRAVTFTVWADSAQEKGVELRWIAPKVDGGLSISNYTVEKREQGHDKWRQALITSTTTGFLSNLDGKKNYQIRVQGNSEAGSGEFSKILDVTLITPLKPRNIILTVATVDGTRLIRLTWDQPEDNNGAQVLEYIIEKRVYGTRVWHLATKTHFTYIDVFLAYSKNHQLRILTRSVAGRGEPSEPLDIIWIKPGPPQDVQFWLFDENGTKNANITWTAHERGKSSVLEYIIKKRVVGGSGWITEARTKSKSFLIKNLDTSNNYDVKVLAVNSLGSSKPSRVVHIPLAYAVSGRMSGSACLIQFHWSSIIVTFVSLLALL